MRADVRRDLAGLQHLRRQQPLHRARSHCPPGNPSTYKAAYKVSYNRPFHTAEDDGGRSWLFTGGEYPMIRFLERNGYDVELHLERRRRRPRHRCCATTSCSSPAATTSTGRPRSAPSMEQARDAGVNLAFFSGNEGFWKTRWEPSTSTAPPEPDARLLQGHPLHRAAGSGRRGPAPGATRASRPRRRDITPENALTGQSLPGQLRHVARSRCRTPSAQLRMWRNTAPRACRRPEPDARARHARLRVGRGRRQRLPAGRGRSSCPRRPPAASRSFTDYGSTTTRPDRDPQHDDVQGRQRRARVQRGHRAVGLGSRRLEPGGNPGRPQHAAGDGEPVRRPRRPARTRCSRT